MITLLTKEIKYIPYNQRFDNCLCWRGTKILAEIFVNTCYPFVKSKFGLFLTNYEKKFPKNFKKIKNSILDSQLNHLISPTFLVCIISRHNITNIALDIEQSLFLET